MEATGSNQGRLADADRVVVKVGSSLLVNATGGTLDRDWLAALSGDIARMQARGQQVALVSSGAIALGRAYLGMPARRRSLSDFQAAAAAGQILLAHAWQEELAAVGLRTAQVLLTLGDSENRRRYLNARGTLESLLAMGVVPVINENDTVATEEIRYGDNDRLAARVAQMTSSDCLVLLSDVDGLYDADPGTTPGAMLMPEIREITEDIVAAAGESRTEFGTGGMATKLEAARMCMSAGCATVIAGGRKSGPLAEIESGSACTWVLPTDTPRAARKSWIAGALAIHGTLMIDDGAVAALTAGGSLLPVGVTGVTGNFHRGDSVLVEGARGQIGRGLAAYGSEDAKRIAGCRSDDIENRLGYRGPDEIIHRDNLVLSGDSGQFAQ
jgi:glutamate 5-kinase